MEKIKNQNQNQSKNKKLNIILSPQLCCIPFVENVDGTREQMAASQMKQSLMLEQCTVPLTITGLEQYQELFTSNVIIAADDGWITYVDSDFIMLLTNSGNKVIYTIDCDYKILVKQDMQIKKNSIIARKTDFMLYGANLLTGICSFHGFNFEDALLASESCSIKCTHKKYKDRLFIVNKNNVMLSLEEDYYKPILLKGDYVKKGDVLLRTKEMNFDAIENFQLPPHEKYSKESGKIVSIALYVNKYNTWLREYDVFIKEYLSNVKKIKKGFNKMLGDEVSKDVNNVLMRHKNLFDRRRYKYANEVIDVAIRYKIESKKNLQAGDKLANRHGNKGIVSTILSDDRMLKIFGKPVDIIINQSGLIKRMNLVGQLKEAKLSLIAKAVRDFAHKVKKKSEMAKLKEMVLYITKKLDNTSNNWWSKQTKYILNNTGDAKLKQDLQKFSILAPPFESPTVKQTIDTGKEFNVPKIFLSKDYISGYNIKFNGGYMFWQILHHLADDKMSMRSIGPYSLTFLQPVSGKKNSGGQRFGEMEAWALACHSAFENLKEIIYFKSDDFGSKVEVMCNIMEHNFGMPKNLNSSISRDFITCLNCLSLDIKKIENNGEEDKILEEDKEKVIEV